MGEGQHHFLSRVRRLERKHNAMTNGYLARVRADGLIEVLPQKVDTGISPRSVVLFLGAFLLFKGFLIASIGLVGYQERVAKLASGSVLEQGGAMIMIVDPLSLMVAEKIGPILR